MTNSGVLPRRYTSNISTMSTIHESVNQPCMAFVPYSPQSLSRLFMKDNSNLKRPTLSLDRRTFFKLLSSALFISPLISLPIQSQAQSESNWDPESLCKCCKGRGKQECSFCSGTGVLSLDDSIIQHDQECPNCQGAGSILCPACIGLGLTNVNGILRNGSRDGTLRMLKNGRYEILDCSAFPSCDIYGNGKPAQL